MLSKLQVLLFLLLIVMGGLIIKNKLYPKAFMREGFEVDRASDHFKYVTKTKDIFDKFILILGMNYSLLVFSLRSLAL